MDFPRYEFSTRPVNGNRNMRPEFMHSFRLFLWKPKMLWNFWKRKLFFMITPPRAEQVQFHNREFYYQIQSLVYTTVGERCQRNSIARMVKQAGQCPWLASGSTCAFFSTMTISLLVLEKWRIANNSSGSFLTGIQRTRWIPQVTTNLVLKHLLHTRPLSPFQSSWREPKKSSYHYISLPGRSMVVPKLWSL